MSNIKKDAVQKNPKDPKVQPQDEQSQRDKEEQKKIKAEQRSLKSQYLTILSKKPEYSFFKVKRQYNQEDFDGVSWGMIDEQEIYRYQQEQEYPMEPEFLKTLSGLSENQLDKIRTYDEKLMKFRQAQEELDDIKQKERMNFGLVEGMKRRKEKLEDKINEQSTDVEQAEENLRYILFGDKVHQSNTMIARREYHSDEEDEYYDNTLGKQGTKKIKTDIVIDEALLPAKPSTGSYSELKRQLEDLIKQRDKTQDQLLNLSNLNTKATEIVQKDEDIDELDAYMRQTTQSLLEESRPKLLQKIQQLSKEMEEVKIQLRTVKPDVDFTDFFKEEKEEQITQQQTEPVQKNEQKKAQPVKGISATLSRLREISKKREEEEQRIQDDNDEELLEKARQHFEQEKLKEIQVEKRKQQERKRLERKAMMEMDDQQDQKPQKKIFGTFQPPKSRHLKESEVEKDGDYIDLVQFQ